MSQPLLIRRFGMFTDKIARALLEAHERECRETRARTDRQFDMVKDTMAAFQIEFQQRFRELIDVGTKRHDTNVGEIEGIKKEVSGIKWYIAAVAGGFAVFLFFADHYSILSRLFAEVK